MNYEITLSGDDLLTIISMLENAGSDSLAVKVRDQMYAQRDAFLASVMPSWPIFQSRRGQIRKSR